MPPLQKNRFKEKLAIALLAVVFFAAFSYLIPKTCDDWAFTRMLLDARGNGGVISATMETYLHLNGRILGNGLSIALAGSKLIRTLFKTAVYAALYLAMCRLTGMERHGGPGLAVTFLLMMLVPTELRNQTYGWDPGFINYAVPTMLIFCYLLLIYPLFSGQRVQDGVWRVLACFALGLTAALFVENVTGYALVLGVGTVVWHIVRHKRPSIVTLAFLAGVIAGLILMLSSPTYAATLAGGSDYRALPTDLLSLLTLIKSNYYAFSYYSFGGSTLLHLLLSGCSIVLLLGAPDDAKPGMRRLKRALLLLLCALPVYFYLTTRVFNWTEMRSAAFDALTGILGSFYVAMLLDALCYGLYVLSIMAAFLLYVPDKAVKRLGLTSIVSALIVGVPMIVVRPTDARCFLPSYLFLAIAALLLLDAAWKARGAALTSAKRAGLALCVYAMMAAVCAGYLALYATCPKIERTRINYLEQQMQIDAGIIVLPEFDCEAYLHYPTTMLGEMYYYETPGDIEMPFIPYEEWNESFSFGLSQEELAAAEARHAAEDGASD